MTLSTDSLRLPWEADSGDVFGESGERIAEFDWNATDLAAYAVRAVNNHEALVAALRTALGATDEDRTPQAADDLQAARKLLASLE